MNNHTKISTLSPEGSFSSKAAKAYNQEKGGIIDYKPTLDEVIRYTNMGSLGVLPLYNNATTDVLATIDIPYKNRLSLLKMYRVGIEFWAGSQDGTLNHDTVYSHPQALAQLKIVGWLERNPQIKNIKETKSTSDSVHVCERDGGIAIAAPEAYNSSGLTVVEKNIATQTIVGNKNFTDIYIAGKKELYPCTLSGAEADYLTMIAITPKRDSKGILRRVIDKIDDLGLNNTKMYERPSPHDMGISNSWAAALMFYLEIEGIHYESPRFSPILHHPDITVIGSYTAKRI